MTATTHTEQGSTTVRAGRTTGQIIRCALSDLLLADLSVSIVFCYDRPLDVPALTEGLRQALAAVPVFAGRLRQRGAELDIVCDDSGAALSVHDMPITLPDAITRLTHPESGLVDVVDAAAARAGTEPLLRVRVNRLSDGGTALACSWQHAVGDMSSFMALMRRWSAAVEGSEDADSAPPPPIDDRAAFLDRVLPAQDSGRPGFRLVDPAELDALALTAAASRLTNRTLQISFTAPELARLRHHLAASPLTTNDALTAHLVHVIRLLDADPNPRHLTVPVDLRPTLALAPDTIGNLLGEVYLLCAGSAPPPMAQTAQADRERADSNPPQPSQLPESAAPDVPEPAKADRPRAEDSPPLPAPPSIPAAYDLPAVARVAADLRAAVRDFARSQLSLRSSQALLADLGPEGMARCVPLGFDPARRTFTVSSWRGFGAYDVRFGGVGPVAVSPAISLPLPWVCWLVEGFGGAGVLATVAVPAAVAARLRSPAGRELLHWCREAGDPVPPLAAAVRRLL